MEDISGQHQVSKGSAPAGVTAGTAIQFLQEADNSYMATTHASVEDCVQKIAYQTVGLAIQYWDSERLVKYVGRDGAVSARYLSNAHLKSGTDIRIESGSSLPTSKAARIALFMDLMNRGFIPAQDGLELMKLPSMKAYWDFTKVDENQAKRENLAMSELPEEMVLQARQMADMTAQSGIPVGIDPLDNPLASQQMEIANDPIIPVNDWDDHEVHLKFHENFMKGQEFQMLPKAVQKEFELHRQRHKDKQFEQQFQDMMSAQGALPPGSEPPTEPGGNQFSGIEEPAVDEQQPPQ
jgi:hypothetical protein